MPTQIEQYKSPKELHPTPTHRVVIADPPPYGEKTGSLRDVSVTVFHSPKGYEVVASQRGRSYEDRIAPGSNDQIIFPQSHDVIIISRT